MSFRKLGRSARGLSRGPRRQTAWSEGPGSGNAISATISATSQVATAGLQIIVDRVTLVRLRGLLTATLAGVTAGGDGFIGAFAIGVAEADAFAIGVTALPSPMTDYEEDWLWWMPIQLYAGAGSTLTNAFGNNARSFEVDTRSQRKLRVGDVVYGILEVTEFAGASTMTFAFDSRMLVKLP